MKFFFLSFLLSILFSLVSPSINPTEVAFNFYLTTTNQIWHTGPSRMTAQLLYTLPSESDQQLLEKFSLRERNVMSEYIEGSVFEPYEGLGYIRDTSIQRIQRLDETRFLLLIRQSICGINFRPCFGYYEVSLVDLDASPQMTYLFKIALHDEILQDWGCASDSGAAIVPNQFLVNPIYDVIALTFDLGEGRKCDDRIAPSTLIVVDFRTTSAYVQRIDGEGAGWSSDGEKLSYLRRRCFVNQASSEQCRFTLRLASLETVISPDAIPFPVFEGEDIQINQCLVTGWANADMVVTMSYAYDYAAGEPKPILTWISTEPDYRVTIPYGEMYPFHPWYYFVAEGSLFVRDIVLNDSEELQSRWEAFQQAQAQAPTVIYNPRFPEYLFLSAVSMDNSVIAVDDSLNQYTLDVTGVLPNGEVIQLITP
jgi:hypothetical protein